MIGKKIKIDDYKFVYGQETIYANVFAYIKEKNNSNKYIIYSYDNKKINYGKAFLNENKITIMSSKEDITIKIDKLIDEIFNNDIKSFEVLSLTDVLSLEVIDDSEYKKNVDINKLYDLTIPKEEDKKENTNKEKKHFSFANFGLILLILVVALFFFINPETIIGKDKIYKCSKSYSHEKIPAIVEESLTITFNGKGKLLSNEQTINYTFSDSDYYTKFKDNSLFYQYISDGDTYKFDDNEKIYKVFKKIDIDKDKSLSTDEKEFISYYINEKYSCKLQSEE